MAYCTQDDIEMRIGEADLVALADYDGDGESDEQVVQAAITNACALIDSYLSVRFSVPLSPVPDVLKARAVNLSVYFLRLGRDSATEDTRRQYDDDLVWLREAVQGQVSLGIEPGPPQGARAPGVQYSGKPRLFGRNEPL
jgi:phage gp36-like protein